MKIWSLMREMLHWGSLYFRRVNLPWQLWHPSKPTQREATDPTQLGRWWIVVLSQWDDPWGQRTTASAHQQWDCVHSAVNTVYKPAVRSLFWGQHGSLYTTDYLWGNVMTGGALYFFLYVLSEGRPILLCAIPRSVPALLSFSPSP